MKKKPAYIVTIFICIAVTPMLLSWGVFGHEHINRAAVLCLPEPVQAFFYNHIDYITQESTVPDLRKYTLNDKAENPRHYIDLENFGAMDSLPLTMDDARKKYDDKFLSKNGTLPWYIDEMMDKLTKAFKEKRKTEILFIAADLGHYLGDAHMPLHTSDNHDGQLTNQKGIHAFWESQLPEMYGDAYNYNCAEAQYIKDVRAETRRIIFSSHALVDTVLLADRQLKESFDANGIYKKDAEGKLLKNKFNQPVHTDAYAEKFNAALKGMVEKQMRRAIVATSSYWYTAWVNAGKPDLSKLDPAALTLRNARLLKEEDRLFKEGKLFGIASEKEF